MGLFKDLLEKESVQKLIVLVEDVAFDALFDLLEKIAARTETKEDDRALATFLREAADRVEAQRPE